MKKIYFAACAAMMTFTVNAENVENEINSTSEAQASENYETAQARLRLRRTMTQRMVW